MRFRSDRSCTTNVNDSSDSAHRCEPAFIPLHLPRFTLGRFACDDARVVRDIKRMTAWHKTSRRGGARSRDERLRIGARFGTCIASWVGFRVRSPRRRLGHCRQLGHLQQLRRGERSDQRFRCDRAVRSERRIQRRDGRRQATVMLDIAFARMRRPRSATSSSFARSHRKKEFPASGNLHRRQRLASPRDRYAPLRVQPPRARARRQRARQGRRADPLERDGARARRERRKTPSSSPRYLDAALERDVVRAWKAGPHLAKDLTRSARAPRGLKVNERPCPHLADDMDDGRYARKESESAMKSITPATCPRTRRHGILEIVNLGATERLEPPEPRGSRRAIRSTATSCFVRLPRAAWRRCGWRAFAASTGSQKFVAIKMIRPEHASGQRFQAMFLDEARIAAAITHPERRADHRPRRREWCFVHRDGMDRRRLAVEAPSRRAARRTSPTARRGAPHPGGHLRRPPCGARATRRRRAADLNVVHRDVSPTNVLLSNKGAPKVIDFGIAKAMGRLAEETSAGVLKGKDLVHVPRASARSRQTVDRRADVWCDRVGACTWRSRDRRPSARKTRSSRCTGSRRASRRIRCPRTCRPPFARS